MGRDTKPGKIVRIDRVLYKYLSERKRKRDSWSAVLRRELGLKSRRGLRDYTVLFALSSDLYADKGELILSAAKKRVKEADLQVKRVKEVR